MKKKMSLLFFGLLSVLFAFGCAGPSRLAMDYGTSHKLAKFNQILNPEAERNLDPVTGLYGSAAHATMERYRKGFEEKSTQPVYSINIGSFGAGK